MSLTFSTPQAVKTEFTQTRCLARCIHSAWHRGHLLKACNPDVVFVRRRALFPGWLSAESRFHLLGNSSIPRMQSLIPLMKATHRKRGALVPVAPGSTTVPPLLLWRAAVITSIARPSGLISSADGSPLWDTEGDSHLVAEFQGLDAGTWEQCREGVVLVTIQLSSLLCRPSYGAEFP